MGTVVGLGCERSAKEAAAINSAYGFLPESSRLREEPMKQLDSVGLEFLDCSPVRVSQIRVVNASVGDVFAAVATDPASWGKWCPGFTEASRWLTPMPPGVGSQREMHAFGMVMAETVLAFEHNQRFAFRVDTVGTPLMKAFVEEWTFAAVPHSPQATTATWTMAVDSLSPAPVMRAFLTIQIKVMMRIATRRLERLVAQSDRP